MRCGGVFFPLLLIVFGAIMLAQNVFPEFYWLRELHLFWPVLLIIWGIALLGRRTGWRNF